MIRMLFSLIGDRERRRLRLLITLIVTAAVLQGLAFVALVPFTSALFTADQSAIGRWLVVLLALGAVYTVVFWSGSQLSQTVGGDLLISLLERLGDRLVELPLGWFATDRSGSAADIATRGIVFAASAPYAILRPVLTAFVTPATVMLGTLFVDWRISLTMAVSAPLIWIAYRSIAGRLREADHAHVHAVGEASSRLIEYARVQPSLRAAGDNTISRGLVENALREQHAANQTLHVTGGAGVGVFAGIVQLAVTAVVVVGTWFALAGSLAVATLVPLLLLAVRFSEPIVHSGALGGGIGMARNTLERITALLREPSLPEPAEPAEAADGSVRFDDVSFGYGGAPVVRQLSFEVPSGTMTAIVGPSGAGKTTIIRLIARFYDPDQGTVSIGNHSLAELGTEAVTRAVTPVFQDVYLFDASIVDNIRFGRPEATREQAIEAGRRARVDEITERLPNGWDARVGEGGTNLSGGERQRISIARALLKDAPIVLLDEATAALDIGNEAVIQEAFSALRTQRTLIVVAHRLQTIVTADRIIMLDTAGRIAETGLHHELLDSDGAYTRYWNERVRATGWRLTDRA